MKKTDINNQKISLKLQRIKINFVNILQMKNKKFKNKKKNQIQKINNIQSNKITLKMKAVRAVKKAANNLKK